MRSAIAVGLLFTAAGAHAAAGPDWAAKVSPRLLATPASTTTEFLVVMKEQADLSAAEALPTKEEKGQFVFERLTETAARTQAGVLADLTARGVVHRSYWVANMVWAQGTRAQIEAMARRDDVAEVAANPKVHFEEPAADAATDSPDVPETIEWGVAKVGAPAFWARGFTGQGAVVAGADTGIKWDHTALKGHYRGWNGTTADHNYNWHDSIHSGGGACGANSPVPCDDFGHGSHTVGTMVGDDGTGNQIGVAPGAKFMGCRNMDQGNGTPATYSECFQFFIAPTDSTNQNPNPAMSPNVINNSWGCPPAEGCSANTLQTVVANTRAAGILVVVSAGNSGSACSTVSDPAAIYDESFSVGATDINDLIAGFSSRGPVTIDSSGRLKPDVSAPGVSVRSVTNSSTTAFATMSGTSMAGPHVAGLSALLMSANPALKGQVSALETLMTHSAKFLVPTQTCGGLPTSARPNNTFGYGRVQIPHTAVDFSGNGVAEVVVYRNGTWLTFSIP